LDYWFKCVDHFFCPMWGNNPCPLWNTPPSVVIFSLNWLVWSVVKLWVERFLDPFPPINELIFGLSFYLLKLMNLTCRLLSVIKL
jgi:hypothetical protein